MVDVLEPPPPPSTSPGTQGTGGSITSARRWLKGLLTQGRVSDSLKTLAWVVPLTLLIWVYAEREQLAKESGVPIPIHLTSADPTRVVTMLRPAEPVVLADLEGPRSELDAVRDGFARTSGVDAVEIIVENLSDGTHELRTAFELGKNSLFVQRGVSVTNCQPPILQVSVDRFREEELPVTIPPSVTEIVTRPGPVFDPPTVKVRVPENAFKEATKLGPVHAYADLVGAPELRTPGSHVLPSVRIRLTGLDEQNVTVVPSTVKATVEVRQANERYTIPFMAVYAVGPVALLKQYRVDCPETIPNVTVIGPMDKIARLKQESPDMPRPYAVLEVSGEDRPTSGAAGQNRRRALRYNLPAGVEIAPEDAQREVDFKLIERAVEQ